MTEQIFACCQLVVVKRVFMLIPNCLLNHSKQ